MGLPLRIRKPKTKDVPNSYRHSVLFFWSVHHVPPPLKNGGGVRLVTVPTRRAGQSHGIVGGGIPSSDPFPATGRGHAPHVYRVAAGGPRGLARRPVHHHRLRRSPAAAPGPAVRYPRSGPTPSPVPRPKVKYENLSTLHEEEGGGSTPLPLGVTPTTGYPP